MGARSRADGAAGDSPRDLVASPGGERLFGEDIVAFSWLECYAFDFLRSGYPFTFPFRIWYNLIVFWLTP